jgi:hypothetical protein
MEQLHRDLSDKLDADVTHLEHALRDGSIELALVAAKRARRHATLLVRHLAEHRDTLQS